MCFFLFIMKSLLLLLLRLKNPGLKRAAKNQPSTTIRRIATTARSFVLLLSCPVPKKKHKNHTVVGTHVCYLYIVLRRITTIEKKFSETTTARINNTQIIHQYNLHIFLVEIALRLGRSSHHFHTAKKSSRIVAQ